jgi:hypothetical protein
MANTFLTGTQIANTAIGLLARQLVLPQTVVRVSGDNFGGTNGDTVTIRVPVKVAAREQATPGAAITYDDITETSATVTVAHLYNGVKVTDEDLATEIASFGAQILDPQIAGVVEGAEAELASVMNALSSDDTFALTATDADTIATLLGARQALSSANVPQGDRFLAVSPEIATRLLSLEGLRDASAAGDSNALREASVGRIFGFTVVESSALTAGTAVAYHRTSFAFANFAAPVPSGAADGAVVNRNSLALRWVRQYDPDILSDRSVVSTFAGAAGLDAGNRAFKLTTATA